VQLDLKSATTSDSRTCHTDVSDSRWRRSYLVGVIEAQCESPFKMHFRNPLTNLNKRMIWWQRIYHTISVHRVEHNPRLNYILSFLRGKWRVGEGRGVTYHCLPVTSSNLVKIDLTTSKLQCNAQHYYYYYYYKSTDWHIAKTFFTILGTWRVNQIKDTIRYRQVQCFLHSFGHRLQCLGQLSLPPSEGR